MFPALTLVEAGYDVHVVADAGGSPTKMADDLALQRMEHGGVTVTGTGQTIAELAVNWATPHSEQLMQVVMGKTPKA